MMMCLEQFMARFDLSNVSAAMKMLMLLIKSRGLGGIYARPNDTNERMLRAEYGLKAF